MQVKDSAMLRFKVVAEADPSALIRVLQFFQARNLIPRRVIAQRMGAEFLEIEGEIESTSLAPEAFCAILAKASELPVVLAAVARD